MNKKDILVIEDHDSTRELWCELLELEDFNCTPCPTGRCALDLLARVKYDLVLCDINLPDTDGFTLKAKLNNDKIRIPLIFVSGLNVTDGVLRARQLGAIRFLTKPVSRELLLSTVKSCLDFAEVIYQKPEFSQPKALLVVTQGGKQQEISISRAYSVGRNKEADIKLMSPHASREHGIFTRIYDEIDKSSFYRIVDYSSNGIEVNNKKIKGYQNLYHGDLVGFPGCTICYYELKDLKGQNPYSTMPS